MANPKKTATARPRRSQREVLEAAVAQTAHDIVYLDGRLAKAKTKNRDAKKRLETIVVEERTNAREQIAHHEAELERLRAIVTVVEAEEAHNAQVA